MFLTVFSFSPLAPPGCFLGRNLAVMFLQNVGHNQIPKSFCLPLSLFASKNEARQCHPTRSNLTLQCMLLPLFLIPCVLFSSWLTPIHSLTLSSCNTFSIRAFLIFQPGWVSHKYFCLHLTQAFQISIELIDVFVLLISLGE